MGSSPILPIIFMIKGYLYILENKIKNKFYIGSSEDVDRRFSEHLSGKVYSTKRLLPLELIFKQEFENIDIARKIELRLKKMKRKDYISKIIKDGYIKIR